RPTPPPPRDRDFAERLRKAGAGSGDVTLSLKWDNTNDLDLHCVDPTGEKICFSNKKGKTGGHLDVDRNVAFRPKTREPVENIFWPAGTAPPGRYRVYVDYFSNNGDAGPTASEVRVRWEGQVKGGTGVRRRGGRDKLVYEFELKPRLRLAVAEEVAVNPDGQNVLPVKIARDRFEDPVTLRVEGNLDGITVAEARIPEKETEARLTL